MKMEKSDYVREVLNDAWEKHTIIENKRKRKKYERKKRVEETGKN